MQLEVGQIVEGKITGIMNFGAFIDLGEGKSGMVHISEVARAFVTDINEFIKVGDTVKVKVLSIGDDGKISLSIKKAMEAEKPKAERKFIKKPAPPQELDSTYTWSAKKQESASFEDMISRFKATSDDKFSDLKKKNPDAHRTKRGTGVR